MAGCIEDLFTQYLGDFDRLKGLNGSPTEQRFQDFAPWAPRCCYCNIKVLRTQHTSAMPALRWGLYCGTQKMIRDHHSKILLFPIDTPPPAICFCLTHSSPALQSPCCLRPSRPCRRRDYAPHRKQVRKPRARTGRARGQRPTEVRRIYSGIVF